ncbi:hypothetical protein B0H13DRAFT_1899616 [Mycena leptocephala]|nr:hypothetical protein B0H13DRAFT_1899616 [Mycena leptocephala]
MPYQSAFRQRLGHVSDLSWIAHLQQKEVRNGFERRTAQVVRQCGERKLKKSKASDPERVQDGGPEGQAMLFKAFDCTPYGIARTASRADGADEPKLIRTQLSQAQSQFRPHTAESEIPGSPAYGGFRDPSLFQPFGFFSFLSPHGCHGNFETTSSIVTVTEHEFYNTTGPPVGKFAQLRSSSEGDRWICNWGNVQEREEEKITKRSSLRSSREQNTEGQRHPGLGKQDGEYGERWKTSRGKRKLQNISEVIRVEHMLYRCTEAEPPRDPSFLNRGHRLRRYLVIPPEINLDPPDLYPVCLQPIQDVETFMGVTVQCGSRLRLYGYS